MNNYTVTHSIGDNAWSRTTDSRLIAEEIIRKWMKKFPLHAIALTEITVSIIQSEQP